MDVFEGALRIARSEYPELDVDTCRDAIGELAREAREDVDSPTRAALDRYNDRFFGRWGFSGNRDAYYDPRNSFVNDVLQRRTGIPISLAAVYAEIAGRLGLQVRGIAFPGHFLVKWVGGRASAVVDCFSGRILTRKDCRELLELVAPAAEPEQLDGYLQATPPSRILSRMLGNLRQIHRRLGDHARVARWITLEIEFNPDDPEPWRDRALAWAELSAFGRAVADMERYIARAPDAPDIEDARRQVVALRRRLHELN